MRFAPAFAAPLAFVVLLAACVDSDAEQSAGRPAVRAFSASDGDRPDRRAPVGPEEGVPTIACGRLDITHRLARGEQLMSCDERVRLFLQLDGNLILDVEGIGVVWESGTRDLGAEQLRMQPSGVLALVDAAARVLWQSHAFGLAGSYASLQDGGDLVIFDPAGRPIWHARAGRSAPRASDDP